MAAGDSVVGICNIGLIALGVTPIASLNDPSKAAILSNARYDQIRRELLRAHDWNFAKKQAQLAAAATPPLFTYANAYPTPADFIRMSDLPDNEQAIWEVIGNQIMTDEGAPLNAVYISDIQDPTRFDPIFVAGLGLAMAVELCEPITGSDTKIARLEQKIEGKLSAARLAGSQENASREWDVDIWLRRRL